MKKGTVIGYTFEDLERLKNQHQGKMTRREIAKALNVMEVTVTRYLNNGLLKKHYPKQGHPYYKADEVYNSLKEALTKQKRLKGELIKN